MRILKLFAIYFFIVIYSLELLLFLFISDEQKNMVDIKNTRVKIATKKKLNIDLRSPEKVYTELKRKNKNIKPVFLYANHFSSFEVFQEAKKNNLIIPFRGPINSQTISCAEDLKYKIIKNDQYGFKNSNDIYKKKINAILLGDSYAEGLCEKSENDIAGNLIKNNINTINLGVTGSGPLVSLAVLREFGNVFKPKNVIYLYFEGNDLNDLNYEKNETSLFKYLSSNYDQDYINRYDEIKLFLGKAEKESESIIYSKSKNAKTNEKKSNLGLFGAHLQDIAELNNLRNILKYRILKKQKSVYDLELFYSVVEKMDYETKKWDGNYVFVYVPTWSRYFTKFTKIDSKINLKNEILKNLKSKNITTVDLTEFFDKEKNIKEYYPLGYLGHFNYKGYKKIAEILETRLN